LNAPFELGKQIDWNTSKVFESGIRSADDVSRALRAGFSGVLVGETVMRNTELIDEMYQTFAPQLGAFWSSLFLKKRKGRPLVKICGITNKQDAYFSAQMGADVLGFIFADSPRKTRPRLLREIQSLDILKVGVVVKDGQKKLIINREIEDLLKNGLLDAVQFHGKESPESCSSFSYQYYKAVRVKGKAEISLIGQYLCPRVLVDTFISSKPGGTGKRIPDNLISEIKANHPLWLAGGIGPQNVREIINRFKPELIDASSLLESEPGKKDHEKIKNLFKEIKIAKNV
jgi:indole-3-glycerol phosphate synthase/phosphoribosylanthranilate isomerase